jgi:adenosylcobinamide-phosphate synthase
LTDGPAAAFRAARGALAAMRRDGREHTSPNSGIPEAAMAGALGVRLGGPSTYGGMLVKKPFIGDGTTGDYRISADRALSLSACAATLATALALACLLVLGKII